MKHSQKKSLLQHLKTKHKKIPKFRYFFFELFSIFFVLNNKNKKVEEKDMIWLKKYTMAKFFKR